MTVVYATDETFNDLVSEGVVIADFFGKTCIPCKMVAPVLEDIEDEFPFIKVVKADVDECPVTAEAFHIDAIPDLYYYKNGTVIFHEPGAVGEDVIKGHLADILYH